MSDPLWPHELQHARLPCPLLSPGVCSDSCPLNCTLLEFAQIHVHWICDAIQPSSVVPFCSYLQSFPASGFFPVNQFFASGGQSIGASASASILPMNIQDWFPLGSTGLIFKYLNNSFENSTQESELVVGHKAVVWQLQLSIILKEYRIAFKNKCNLFIPGEKAREKVLWIGSEIHENLF